MNALEFFGIIAIGIAIIKILHKIFRKIFPKKYTYENCPNDHDTMSRCGRGGRCDKCGNEI